MLTGTVGIFSIPFLLLVICIFSFILWQVFLEVCSFYWCFLSSSYLFQLLILSSISLVSALNFIIFIFLFGACFALYFLNLDNWFKMLDLFCVSCYKCPSQHWFRCFLPNLLCCILIFIYFCFFLFTYKRKADFDPCFV